MLFSVLGQSKFASRKQRKACRSGRGLAVKLLKVERKRSAMLLPVWVLFSVGSSCPATATEPQPPPANRQRKLLIHLAANPSPTRPIPVHSSAGGMLQLRLKVKDTSLLSGNLLVPCWLDLIQIMGDTQLLWVWFWSAIKVLSILSHLISIIDVNSYV